jgi:hypothetical protein
MEWLVQIVFLAVLLQVVVDTVLDMGLLVVGMVVLEVEEHLLLVELMPQEQEQRVKALQVV